MRRKRGIFKHQNGEFFKYVNNEKKNLFKKISIFLNECVTFSLICKILL